MLPMRYVVARSSSNGFAISYVLPLLWMTSYLRITAHMETCIDTVAANDVIASSCAVHRIGGVVS